MNSAFNNRVKVILLLVLIVDVAFFIIWFVLSRSNPDKIQLSPSVSNGFLPPPTVTPEQRAAIEAVLKANPPHNTRTNPIPTEAEKKAMINALKNSGTTAGGSRTGP